MNQSGFSLVADEKLSHSQFMNMVLGLKSEINELSDIAYACCPFHEKTAEWYGLTTQQKNITLYIVDGHSKEEAAATFGISVETVRSHYRATKRKILGRDKSPERSPEEVSYREYRAMLRSFGIPPKQSYIPEITII